MRHVGRYLIDGAHGKGDRSMRARKIGPRARGADTRATSRRPTRTVGASATMTHRTQPRRTHTRHRNVSRVAKHTQRLMALLHNRHVKITRSRRCKLDPLIRKRHAHARRANADLRAQQNLYGHEVNSQRFNEARGRAQRTNARACAAQTPRARAAREARDAPLTARLFS